MKHGVLQTLSLTSRITVEKLFSLSGVQKSYSLSLSEIVDHRL